jgi:hypothetical protein
MLFEPLVSVRVVGKVIAYVAELRPVTANAAEETAIAEVGSVTPPEGVLTLKGDKTTVPAFAFTAIAPKFISTFFVIESGVMMVADPVAVADTPTCALTVVNPDTKTMAAINVIKFFMALSF